MKNLIIDNKIEGNYKSELIYELLENSLHFPLANLVLEALQENLLIYFREPDPYILLLTAIGQSAVIVHLKKYHPKFKFLGNLIGPLLYGLIEAPLEGPSFFKAPQHIAFWCFALLMMVFQFASSFDNKYIKNLFLLFENIIRSLIPLALYVLFESKNNSVLKILPGFFAEIPHIFISISLILIGILLGISNIKRDQDQKRIKELAHQLKTYSQWSLGSSILNQAVQDESIFQIKRVDRTILFFDIRGFTSWSEKHSPEEVVEMLNQYYLISEKIIKTISPIKSKYTADEIMLVYKNEDDGIKAALELRNGINFHLATIGLSAGGGLHVGPVVEGLMGGDELKLFDVMGDSVNTAKRLCESAKGSEILISENLIERTAGRAFAKESREVILKGKQFPQKVYPLENYFS